MNCQQFQEVLPHIVESGGNAEDEQHLKTCDSCAALVKDLLYIAEQAKLLLPMHDPNPRVWSNIEQSLQREGLLPEGRMCPPAHITKNPTSKTKDWTPLGLVLALIVLALFTVTLINYQPRQLPQDQLPRKMSVLMQHNSLAMAMTSNASASSAELSRVVS